MLEDRSAHLAEGLHDSYPSLHRSAIRSQTFWVTKCCLLPLLMVGCQKFPGQASALAAMPSSWSARLGNLDTLQRFASSYHAVFVECVKLHGLSLLPSYITCKNISRNEPSSFKSCVDS